MSKKSTSTGATLDTSGKKSTIVVHDIKKFTAHLKNKADKFDKELQQQQQADGEQLINITAAAIKDDLCNYSFDIIEGVGAGDTHTVKGKGLVDDDMLTAFSKLRVHLAVIDDVFKHSRKKIESVNKLHGDDLTMLYTVTGFKLKGSKDDPSVILIGTKNVSTASDQIQLESPKILLDRFSSYEYHRELKSALDKCIREVELYREGKYTPVEEPQEEENAAQAKLPLAETSDAEFEKGKVKD